MSHCKFCQQDEPRHLAGCMNSPEAREKGPSWTAQDADKIISAGEAAMAEVDMVSHPPHYESHPSGIQPIEITRHESFCLGNVLKYCMRAKYKGNEIQDLRKAAQYLQWEIERLEAKS